MKKKTIIFLFAKYFIGLIVLVIICRICFLDVYNIPSNSMKDKLEKGDMILINKTTYSGLLSNLGAKSKTNYNDILVFKKNLKQSDHYIKRCIGLSGDTIGIYNGIISINQKKIKEASTVRKSYDIYYKNFNKLSQKIKTLGIHLYLYGYNRNAKYFNLSLNEIQLTALKNNIEIDSIAVSRLSVTKTNDKSVYMEPYVIPYRGLTISLMDRNFGKYEYLMTEFENAKITHDKKETKINGHPVSSYTFKLDYIFLLGDNRDNSVDSRYFGAIPLKNITGKYICSF